MHLGLLLSLDLQILQCGHQRLHSALIGSTALAQKLLGHRCCAVKGAAPCNAIIPLLSPAPSATSEMRKVFMLGHVSSSAMQAHASYTCGGGIMTATRRLLCRDLPLQF